MRQCLVRLFNVDRNLNEQTIKLYLIFDNKCFSVATNCVCFVYTVYVAIVL